MPFSCHGLGQAEGPIPVGSADSQSKKSMYTCSLMSPPTRIIVLRRRVRSTRVAPVVPTRRHAIGRKRSRHEDRGRRASPRGSSGALSGVAPGNVGGTNGVPHSGQRAASIEPRRS